MADYNHVTLVGKPANIELKTITTDRVRTSWDMLITRPYKDVNGKKVVDTFKCVAWGKLAETVKEFCSSGIPCLVDGYLQSQTYERDGAEYHFVVVVAENISLLGKK